MNGHYIEVVDLFCGIGGVSYGLKQAGMRIRFGIDNDIKCRYSYEQNNKAGFIHRDITELSGKSLDILYTDNALKVLVACAPCQPFSTINKTKNLESHEKYWLISEVTRIVSEYSFDIVVCENVPGLMKNGLFDDFVSTLKENGYHVYYEIINCLDYGIPQTRKRLILIASKLGRVDGLPQTHSKTGDYGLEKHVTVRDVIGDLNTIKTNCDDGEYPLHRAIRLSDINLKRIQQSKPGGNYTDWDPELWRNRHKRGKTDFTVCYSRLEWDKPAGTMTTEYFNFGTGRFGHPEQDRALSVLEGMLLQTFPIDYQLYENNQFGIAETAKHIGNAVPVKLAEYIGTHIRGHINYYMNK